jgi:hypothetical protein
MSKVLTAITLVLALMLPAASLGVGVSNALAAAPASHSTPMSVAGIATPPPKPKTNACQTASYSTGVWIVTTKSNCYVVPPSGQVNTVLCGVHFVGTAAPGTAITCQVIPLLIKLPCSSSVSLPTTGGATKISGTLSLNNYSTGMSAARSTSARSASSTVCCETGVSLSIQGTDLNLTVPGAKIYKFNPATGTSTLVSAVTGNGGEYTFVYGSCPSSVTTTPVTLPRTGGGIGGLLNPLLPSKGPSFPFLPMVLGALLVLLGAGMATRSRKSQV